MAQHFSDAPPPYSPYTTGQPAAPGGAHAPHPAMPHGQPGPVAYGAQQSAAGCYAPHAYGAPEQPTHGMYAPNMAHHARLHGHAPGVYVYPSAPQGRQALYAAPHVAHAAQRAPARPKTRRRCCMTIVHLVNAFGGVIGGTTAFVAVACTPWRPYSTRLLERYGHRQISNMLLFLAFVASGAASAAVVHRPPGAGRLRALRGLRATSMALFAAALAVDVLNHKEYLELYAVLGAVLLLPFWAMPLPAHGDNGKWWLPVVRV